MKNNFLIPAKYKVLGWTLTLIFGILGILCLFYNFHFSFLQYAKPDTFEDRNFTNEIALTGTILGLLVIVFSKQKLEDEFISLIRLKSLQLSVLISYLIFMILNFSCYNLYFYTAIFYNTFTILVLFIIIFQWKLFNLSKEGGKDEK